MFFYYQLEGGQESWRHDLLESFDKVITKHQPRYVTALALSRPLEPGLAPEDLERISYAGPLYVDFDAKELSVAIRQFNLFLDKLVEHDVDLDCVRLYASGGRGFHAEIPMKVFLPKLPKDGIVGLPYIYKEMIYPALFVDTLDLRVYSGKRGRMWRTPNVQRENGKFKVPITPAEARSMTGELYEQLCSSPRQYVSAAAWSEVEGDPHYVPVPKEPTHSLDLTRLFAEAMIKVKEGLARRKKGAKQVEALAKFKGEWPPTLVQMLQGHKLKADAGWNQLAMQIAIVGNALGRTADQVVADARELIDSHKGNSGRYATPQLREQELRNQLAYTHDNPCYTYSVGAIKVLLEEGTPTADLEGVTDTAALQDIAAAAAERTEAGESTGDDELERGVVVGTNGIRQRTREGWVTWTNVGFDKVSLIVQAATGEPLMFEADLYCKGIRRGRVQIPLEVFLSRQKFHAYVTAKTGASFQGADATVQAIQEAMFKKSQQNSKENAMEFVLRREGLDVIQFPANLPVADAARDPFPVWVTVDGCYAPKRITDAGLTFRFLGSGKPQGEHQSDIRAAPDLEDTPELRRLINSLFNLNKPRTIGPMLGWLAACHARMFYHRYKGRFPLLGVSGEQGAGKTTTLRALGKLHFYRREMPEIQFGSTHHAIEEAVLGSCSVPTVISEYKPRTANQEKVEKMRATFRGAYDNGVIRKGGGVQIALSAQREVSERQLSGPIAYVGLVPETEPELEERTVQSIFETGGHLGREKHLAIVERDAHLFSSVGKQIAYQLIGVRFEDFCDSFDRDFEVAHKRLSSGRNPRIVSNYAMALHGLTLLDSALQGVGIDISERLEELRDAVLEGPVLIGGQVTDAGDGASRFEVKTEIAKTLSWLAMMSLTGVEAHGTRLKLGTDYDFDEVGGEDVLELNVPFAFAKLEEWCARQRRQMFYANEDTFRFALRNFEAYLDSTPQKLKAEHVMRFRLDAMRRAQVSSFKKPGGV